MQQQFQPVLFYQARLTANTKPERCTSADVLLDIVCERVHVMRAPLPLAPLGPLRVCTTLPAALLLYTTSASCLCSTECYDDCFYMVVLPCCRFVLHLPENLPMDASAPLLCAGITTYSPLKHYGLNKAGMKIGVVGLGGLGHMAVKIGKAMGLEVCVSTSATLLSAVDVVTHQKSLLD